MIQSRSVGPEPWQLGLELPPRAGHDKLQQAPLLHDLRSLLPPLQGAPMSHSSLPRNGSESAPWRCGAASTWSAP
jgi:hypothetical protein